MKSKTPGTGKRALIIRNAYAYDFGGGERFPVLLARQLQDEGFQPIVVSRSSRLLRLAETHGVQTIKGWWWSRQAFNGRHAILFPVYVTWQILLCAWYMSLILWHDIRILHPQSRDDFIAATVAGKLLGRRVIWTDHADLKYVWQNHAVWYKNPVGKLVYAASRLADRITLVSESERNHIQESLGHELPDKFVVIHNGVSDATIQPVGRAASDTDAVIFTATSRLVSSKGIGELINAFTALDTDVETRLWLVGDGPEQETFQQQAYDDARITFMGFSDDALSYVAEADIFVHPSYHEGFSISLVEAAMLGKPIIACDVGGNPEIVQGGVNGLLVPPRDAAALNAAMIKLLSDPDMRARYGKASRRIYEKSFNFDEIVKERFVQLYEA